MARRSPDELNRGRVLRGIMTFMRGSQVVSVVDPETFLIVPDAPSWLRGCVEWQRGPSDRKFPIQEFYKVDHKKQNMSVRRVVWELWRYSLSDDQVIKNFCGNNLCVSIDPDHNRPIPKGDQYKYRDLDDVGAKRGYGWRSHEERADVERAWAEQDAKERQKPKKNTVPTEEEFLNEE